MPEIVFQGLARGTSAGYDDLTFESFNGQMLQKGWPISTELRSQVCHVCSGCVVLLSFCEENAWRKPDVWQAHYAGSFLCTGPCQIVVLDDELNCKLCVFVLSHWRGHLLPMRLRCPGQATRNMRSYLWNATCVTWLVLSGVEGVREDGQDSQDGVTLSGSFADPQVEQECVGKPYYVSPSVSDGECSNASKCALAYALSLANATKTSSCIILDAGDYALLSELR
eukprot:1825409-Amphidinium_carterae.3